MKDQHGSALEGQHQHDLKRANEPQDLHRPGQHWDNPPQVPQTSGLQISEKNPTGNEPESESQFLKLQKMTSQQARGVEQPPVNPLNRNPKQVPFAALLPTLMAQLDKDRALQLRTLYSRLKVTHLTFCSLRCCLFIDFLLILVGRKMKSPKRGSPDI